MTVIKRRSRLPSQHDAGCSAPGEIFLKTSTHPQNKMAAYDSDSDFEDDNFTETNVLLGYATKDAVDDTTSQLGGHPVR